MPHLSTVMKIVCDPLKVRFDSIIWDWNGTLLDDVEIAISIINKLLLNRGLNPIDRRRYLDVFTFPVREYYLKIGFDLEKEPFEIPASQFISAYNVALESCCLHHNAGKVLSGIKVAGFRQFILSAMEQRQLDKSVFEFGIADFFEDLRGLDNHYASSKVENGKLLLEEKGLNPEHTLLVGDTIHDFEVAKAIGCSCILIAHGHQSKARLVSTGANVLDNLSELGF